MKKYIIMWRLIIKNTQIIMESRFFLGGVLALCVLRAFCIGFYMPDLWTTNGYITNFFDGFFRRSLIGTLLYPFGDLRLNYHFIALVQLSVGCGLLLCVLRLVTAVQSTTMYIYLLVCAFFFSRWGAFFFNTQGYPEYVMYLITLIAAQMKNNAARCLLIAATVWIHEMAIFTCVPLWFAVEYIYFNRKHIAWVGLATCFISFLVIYLFFQTAENKAVGEYMQFISSARYVPKYNYMKIFSVGLADSMFRWNSWYGKDSFYYLEGPYFVFVLLAACFLSVAVGRSQKMLAGTIVLSTALSPLLVGWFGFDINRWSFLAIVNISALFAVLNSWLKTGKEKMSMFTFVAVGLLLTAPEPIQGVWRNFHGMLKFIITLPQYIVSIPLPLS